MNEFDKEKAIEKDIKSVENRIRHVFNQGYEAGLKHGKALEQEPKWIPCSERMPEKSGLYLVSGKGKVWICEMLNLMDIKGWCGGLKEPIVEAWMPLPEPYKEESEE